MIDHSLLLAYGRAGKIRPPTSGCVPARSSPEIRTSLVAQVHTRMPIILAEKHHEKWLGEIEDGDLKELLKPYPADQMKMWPISQRVNSPKNDDEAILSHIEPDVFNSALAAPMQNYR
jgi:SOS response associated peptidase (SRAP)